DGGRLTAVSNNFITGKLTSLGTGRAISINADAGSIGPIFGNDLSGNRGLAIKNGTGTHVDASGNWYGVNTPSGVAGAVSGPVDYTPWLNVGTENPSTASDPGFQGDFSSLHVDDASPQTTGGRITEAIG